jgi:peptide/nickel transport system substrate-binding protein
MKRMSLRSLASNFLVFQLLLATLPAQARTRPQYGGTAVVELREAVFELDPISAQSSAEFRNHILPLVFETMTSLDEQGQPKPLLALSFTRVHNTRWSFVLRKDVRFADGSPLVANGVADQLSKLLPSAKVRIQSDGQLIIDTPAPWDNLPQVLSLPRYSIYKQYEDGTLAGTGPYQVSQWLPGRGLLLERNAAYWGPAPYLDRVDVRFSSNTSSVVTPARSGSDLLELTLEQARNVTQASAVRSGEPTQLYVLVWSTKNTVDERIRNAVPQLIVRDSLASAFSRDGVKSAYSYLPQSVSGYSFLFQDDPDISAARSLITDSGRKLPVSLAYSSTDPVARLLAERVAVNARDAALTIQAYGDRNPQSALSGSANAAIIRIPVMSDSPAVALFSLASDLQLNTLPVISAPDSERLLDAERGLLSDTRVAPLAFAPTTVWLSSRFHDVGDGAQWQLDSAWVTGGSR